MCFYSVRTTGWKVTVPLVQPDIRRSAGVTKEEITSQFSRQPFSPLRLVLKDGRKYDVLFAEAARIAADRVMLFIGAKQGTRQAERCEHISYESITAIEPLPSAAHAGPATVRCSFCGDNVLERHALQGSDDIRICIECIGKGLKIIGRMQSPYRCNFCGESRTGSEMVEGPDGIHACADCLTGAIGRLASSH
jgi:hypothetical protein